MPLELTELVARSALFPKVLDVATGIISPEQVVSPLSPKTFASGIEGYALSVGRLTMLLTTEAVHDFGCRVAASVNSEFEKRNGRPPARPAETVHYVGSYDLHVDSVTKIDSETFRILVEYFPENGLDEHCDIELHPRDPAISKNKRKNARTGVIAQLMLLLENPREHICACDEDLRSDLEEIRL